MSGRVTQEEARAQRANRQRESSCDGSELIHRRTSSQTAVCTDIMVYECRDGLQLPALVQHKH